MSFDFDAYCTRRSRNEAKSQKTVINAIRRSGKSLPKLVTALEKAKKFLKSDMEMEYEIEDEFIAFGNISEILDAVHQKVENLSAEIFTTNNSEDANKVLEALRGFFAAYNYCCRMNEADFGSDAHCKKTVDFLLTKMLPHGNRCAVLGCVSNILSNDFAKDNSYVFITPGVVTLLLGEIKKASDETLPSANAKVLSCALELFLKIISLSQWKEKAAHQVLQNDLFIESFSSALNFCTNPNSKIKKIYDFSSCENLLAIFTKLAAYHATEMKMQSSSSSSFSPSSLFFMTNKELLHKTFDCLIPRLVVDFSSNYKLSSFGQTDDDVVFFNIAKLITCLFFDDSASSKKNKNADIKNYLFSSPEAEVTLKKILSYHHHFIVNDNQDQSFNFSQIYFLQLAVCNLIDGHPNKQQLLSFTSSSSSSPLFYYSNEGKKNDKEIFSDLCNWMKNLNNSSSSSSATTKTIPLSQTFLEQVEITWKNKFNDDDEEEMKNKLEELKSTKILPHLVVVDSDNNSDNNNNNNEEDDSSSSSDEQDRLRRRQRDQ